MTTCRANDTFLGTSFETRKRSVHGLNYSTLPSPVPTKANMWSIIGAPAHEGIDSPWQSGHDSIVFLGHDHFLVAGFNNPSEK